MAHGPHTKKALNRIAQIKDDTLDLSWLNIKSMPPIPSTLTTLNLSYSNLNELAEIPQNLINLNCAYTNLKFLPPLPQTLVNFNCDHCKHLQIHREPNETIAEYEARWNLRRAQKADE